MATDVALGEGGGWWEGQPLNHYGMRTFVASY